MISVIIPSYKNKELLLTNLKHNLQYLPYCEVIIVNDDPTDSLKQDLKEFPQILLIENPENKGFGQSVNLGLTKAKYPFVMLLNSDVCLIDDSFKNALRQLKKDSTLFAISFAQKEKDGSLVGKNKLYWKNGMIYHQKSNNLTFGINGWAEGGSCLIDRKKFMDLKGFDSQYKPFYWEDIDLSYRAWKHGYKVFFDPEIIVEHNHESTIGKYFTPHTVETTSFRNQFIFIWKNITDIKLILSHICLLPYNIVYYFLMKGRFNFLLGLLEAIKRVNEVLVLRKDSCNGNTLSDEKILLGFRYE